MTTSGGLPVHHLYVSHRLAVAVCEVPTYGALLSSDPALVTCEDCIARLGRPRDEYMEAVRKYAMAHVAEVKARRALDVAKAKHWAAQRQIREMAGRVG